MSLLWSGVEVSSTAWVLSVISMFTILLMVPAERGVIGLLGVCRAVLPNIAMLSRTTLTSALVAKCSERSY